MEYLGIDVGKRELHASLIQDQRVASRIVPNSDVGVAQLHSWLVNRKAKEVHACLEATGGWSEQVAIALCELGHLVSVVNPSRIKAFANSEMLRTKTDGIDAALIARFCRLHRPQIWNPPAKEIRMLQGLVRREHNLIDMRVEEKNRLGSPMLSPAVAASIEATLDHIAREVDRVLTSGEN